MSSELFFQPIIAPEGGMNQEDEAYVLDEANAVYIQDGLSDHSGQIRMRGGFNRLGDSGQQFWLAARRPTDGSGSFLDYLLKVSTQLETIGVVPINEDVTLNTALERTQSNMGAAINGRFNIFSASEASNKETIVGLGLNYKSDTQKLYKWGGGRNSDYSIGTITTTLNSKTVTGVTTAWSTGNIAKDIYIISGNDVIGIVKSIDSATQLTLRNNALKAVSGATYKAVMAVGLTVKVSKGRITTATTSTTATGSETKFKDQKLDTGTWRLFRLRDYTSIGTVSSVSNNLSLTLTANASIATNNERYIAIKDDSMTFDVTSTGLGPINASYAGRHFYTTNLKSPSSMKSRVWFSDLIEPESVDMSEVDGDFFDVSGDGTTPVIALVPTKDSLFILKENECFALYGSTPDEFVIRKIADIGSLSLGSVQLYKEGCIFAGKRGIFYFDGTSVTSLSDKIRTFWSKAINLFTHTNHFIYSMLYKDHYFLHIDGTGGPSLGWVPPRGVIKNATETTRNLETICINLDTGAIGFVYNLALRGATKTFAGETIFSVKQTNASPDTGIYCKASDLFNRLARDSHISVNYSTAGPDFYWETRKYQLSDVHTLQKFIRWLTLHYKCVGDSIKVDTVFGLNTSGNVLSTTFPSSATFTTKRLNINKRKQFYVAFRFYQNALTSTDLAMDAGDIAWKPHRSNKVS